jgi:hypothetical protein
MNDGQDRYFSFDIPSPQLLVSQPSSAGPSVESAGIPYTFQGRLAGCAECVGG